MSLQQIRDYVRTHLDLDQDDLPDVVLDAFIREGSKRIERAETRWPFYQANYTLSTAAGVSDYDKALAISTELDQVATVLDPSYGALKWLGMNTLQELQARRPSSSSRPRYFAEWGGLLTLYPTPDQVYTLTVRAYRRPLDWMAGGGGAEPDLPDELHNTVALWAMAKSYAQQEDPELAALYERQFSDELDEYRRRLVITPHPQPMVLNGGTAQLNFPVPLRYDWQV